MAFGKLLGTFIAVLGSADDGKNTLGLEGLLVQTHLFDDIFQDPLGIISIINGKVLAKADAVDIPPQDPHAG